MTIPAELSNFRDETDLQRRFIVPLLHQLGFSVVLNYHGSREFGRDLIFGEIDRWARAVLCPPDEIRREYQPE
jgi:hypothetical protein